MWSFKFLKSYLWHAEEAHSSHGLIIIKSLSVVTINNLDPYLRLHRIGSLNLTEMYLQKVIKKSPWIWYLRRCGNPGRWNNLKSVDRSLVCALWLLEVMSQKGWAFLSVINTSWLWFSVFVKHAQRKFCSFSTQCYLKHQGIKLIQKSLI